MFDHFEYARRCNVKSLINDVENVNSTFYTLEIQ